MNVMGLTDAAGVVKERYKYDPYGAATVTLDDSSGNPYLFTGRRYDPDSGLYYYRNRYYHPALGRFLQRDPIGYTDTMDLYEYARGKALVRLDPFGLGSYRTPLGTVTIDDEMVPRFHSYVGLGQSVYPEAGPPSAARPPIILLPPVAPGTLQEGAYGTSRNLLARLSTEIDEFREWLKTYSQAVYGYPGRLSTGPAWTAPGALPPRTVVEHEWIIDLPVISSRKPGRLYFLGWFPLGLHGLVGLRGLAGLPGAAHGQRAEAPAEGALQLAHE